MKRFSLLTLVYLILSTINVYSRPYVRLTPDSGKIGQLVTVTGGEWTPGNTMVVSQGIFPNVASATVEADGTFRTQFTIILQGIPSTEISVIERETGISEVHNWIIEVDLQVLDPEFVTLGDTVRMKGNGIIGNEPIWLWIGDVDFIDTGAFSDNLGQFDFELTIDETIMAQSPGEKDILFWTRTALPVYDRRLTLVEFVPVDIAPELENNIRNALDKQDGVITAHDMLQLTYLSAITDSLDGLEYALNLKRLNVSSSSDYQVSSLAPLANLKKLEMIEISNAKISTLAPLSGCESLKQIRFNDNPITDISGLAPLSRLETIDMMDCKVVDIAALAGCTSLTYLNIRRNNIVDIASLANLSKLRDVAIQNNPIEDLFPLVQNLAFAAHDKLQVSSTHLSSTSMDIYIPVLESRGVSVSIQDTPLSVKPQMKTTWGEIKHETYR